MKIRTLLLLVPCLLPLSSCSFYKGDEETPPGTKATDSPTMENVIARPDDQIRPVLQRPNAEPVVKKLLEANPIPLVLHKLDEKPAPPPRYEIRIRGAKIGDLTTTLVGIRDVAVGLNGERLPSEVLATKAVDLANPAQAWLIGRFEAPADVEELDVVVQLDDFGGFVGGTDQGALNTRTPPLHFVAKMSSLKLRGHAVIELDLAKSVVAVAAGERALIPTYVVNY